MTTSLARHISFLSLMAIGCAWMATSRAATPTWESLFTRDGAVTSQWVVRHRADVSEPVKRAVTWEVRDGILHGAGRYSSSKEEDWIGTWLMSESEYGDFNLELDFKFKNGGLHGNGGVALRAPLKGDPAYEGFELQITDPRYERSFFPNATPDEMTGALYFVREPDQQVYRAGEWNHYRIEMRGTTLKAWLNDTVIHDIDLATLTAPAKRHGKGEEILPAAPGATRPLRGHIGFQDLSDQGETLLFRNVRIRPLD